MIKDILFYGTLILLFSLMSVENINHFAEELMENDFKQ